MIFQLLSKGFISQRVKRNALVLQLADRNVTELPNELRCILLALPERVARSAPTLNAARGPW